MTNNTNGKNPTQDSQNPSNAKPQRKKWDKPINPYAALEEKDSYLQHYQVRQNNAEKTAAKKENITSNLRTMPNDNKKTEENEKIHLDHSTSRVVNSIDAVNQQVAELAQKRKQQPSKDPKKEAPDGSTPPRPKKGVSHLKNHINRAYYAAQSQPNAKQSATSTQDHEETFDSTITTDTDQLASPFNLDVSSITQSSFIKEDVSPPNTKKLTSKQKNREKKTIDGLAGKLFKANVLQQNQDLQKGDFTNLLHAISRKPQKLTTPLTPEELSILGNEDKLVLLTESLIKVIEKKSKSSSPETSPSQADIIPRISVSQNFSK